MSKLPVAIGVPIEQEVKATGSQANEITYSIAPPTALAFPPKSKMNQTSDAPVPLFEQAGVPFDLYWRLFGMVETSLLPVAVRSYEMDRAYDREMDAYQQGTVRKQSHGGNNGIMMQSQMGILQRNLDLVATRLVHRANAMLMKYGIGCTYALGKTKLERYSANQKGDNEKLDIIGIEFYAMDK
ncbi:hypothetical protein ACHAWF_013045 [Thalassiosira exigua]